MAADLLKQLANAASNAREMLTFQRGIERELLRTTQQGASGASPNTQTRSAQS